MNQQQAKPVAWPLPPVAGLAAIEAGGGRGAGPALEDMVQAVRRSARGLAIWTAVLIGLTGFYLVRTAPEFVATAQIVLEPHRQIAMASESQAEVAAPALDSPQADSQVQVVKSERNLRFVFDTMALAGDPAFAPAEPGLLRRLIASLLPRPAEMPVAERARRAVAASFQNFADRVSVRRIGQSYALEIAFRAPSGAMAARLANAITAAYIRDQIEFKAAAVERGSEFLQGRIANIQTEKDVAVEAVRTGIIPNVPFANSDARVVSSATEPLGKASPQPLVLLPLATVFGLVSGIGFVLVRHSLDRRIRSRHQVGEALGIDCLSILPRLPGRRGGPASEGDLPLTAVLDAPLSPFAEALRTLRTAIFVSSKARHAAVGVVSWSSGEGRSAVAANLAFLIAASREKVVLIDADVRDPALSRQLAPDATVGLSEALLASASTAQLDCVELAEGLAFLPAVARGRAINPNVFIGSAEMQTILLALRRDRDVVVDLPPMSLSSQAQAIGPLLDGVVLLVETGRTTVDEMLEALRGLRAADIRLFGVVLNKMPPPRVGRRRGGFRREGA